MIRRFIDTACMAALAVLLSVSARAESGDLNIDGTWVHVEIDHDQDIGTFSNSCGTQVLTHQELAAGAKPDDIIPCPRPSGESAQCEQVKSDFDDQMNNRPMSDAWKRAAGCIPGLVCEAACRDFDDYEQVLEENSALERKWVFECGGTLTLGNGGEVDQSGYDAHHDKIYQSFLQKKQKVCDAERSAALEQEKQQQQQKQPGRAKRRDASPKGANPKFLVSASDATSLPRSQRWMASGSPADCAAARALDKTTAGWYDMCAPSARRGGAQDGASCGNAGAHIQGGACWALGIIRSDCDDLRGQIVDSGGYQYCVYDATAAQTATAPDPERRPDDLRARLRKSLSAGGNAPTDTQDDSAQAGPETASAPAPPAAPPAPRQTAEKTMTPQEERKACAALGSRWRYDPTATYNFSPGAPPKCFPIFTDSLEGEPGFQQKE